MAGPAQVNVVLPELTEPQRAQLKSLEKELRCLVCQNQTLAESDADLASDLRNHVHKLVARNLDDAQIKDYLVQRYGDFVLYKPPLKRSTALLWGGPFALLAIGAGTWFMIGRRRAVAHQSEKQPNTAVLDKPDATSHPAGDATASPEALREAARLLDKS